MIDPDMVAFVRNEIRRHLQIILSGAVANPTTQIEDIENMYPAMPTVTKRPVMHPFGVASCATSGTIQVVGQQGDHPGNRIVLGHRDKNRPNLLEGEVVLYNAHGRKIELKKTSMAIQKDDVELLDQLIKLLDTIINARTNTVFGPEPLIPDPIGEPDGKTFLQIKAKIQEIKGS